MHRETEPIRILTFTGPSAAGKTTLIKELMRRNPEIELVVSCTTRPRRDTDLPGEYAYLSDGEFEELRRDEAFLWTAHAHGNWYGTLRRSLDEALAARWPRVMILVPETVTILRSYARGRSASFFVDPPPEAVLRERLERRALRKRPDGILTASDEEEIRRRIEDCRTWLDEARSSAVPYAHLDNSGDIAGSADRLEAELRSMGILP